MCRKREDSNMVIKDKIYIDLTKETVNQEILQALTYRNPEYFQKKNMGIAVKKWKNGVVISEIPQELMSYKINGNFLEIFRGEYRKIRPFINHLDFNVEHTDHSGINLKYINKDFELDKYQNGAIEEITTKKQGIIHAVTSAGKSLIILKAICEINQKAVIIVHRKTLMQQFLKDIELYIRDENGEKITPGIIGDGKLTLGKITIAIDKTLSKNLDKFKDSFGTVFLDECHLAPANTMMVLLNNINSIYRFGVSGTLKRKDGKEFLMFATFGQVLFEIKKEELEAMGRVVPVKIEIWESQTKFDMETAIEEFGLTKARMMMRKTISLDPLRNKMIIDNVSKLKGKTMILSEYVDPCIFLSGFLESQHNIKSGIITGKNSKKAIEDYNKMKYGDLSTIFATVGCVSTGVSISDLKNLVLISPILTNELLLHQIRGRLMRTADGKEYGTLYFVFDPYLYEQYQLNQFLNIMKK